MYVYLYKCVVLMLPVLNLKHDEVASSAVPPAPTVDGDERYFYLMHRPGDSFVPRPAKVAEIVSAGGIRPGGKRHKIDEKDQELYESRYEELFNKKYPKYEQFNEFGMDKNLVRFLELRLGPHQKADGRELKDLVSWYYLGNYNRSNILDFASDDELVFRVPVSWLIQHAVSSVENPTFTNEDVSFERFAPWAFLTTQIVPIDYRIFDPRPLTNEETRVMSNTEVGKLIFETHTTRQPEIRSEKYWVRKAEQKMAREKELQKKQPRINPF